MIQAVDYKGKGEHSPEQIFEKGEQSNNFLADCRGPQKQNEPHRVTLCHGWQSKKDKTDRVVDFMKVKSAALSP